MTKKLLIILMLILFTVGWLLAFFTKDAWSAILIAIPVFYLGFCT